MAKLQLGVNVQSIRGSIGTGIYQVWKGIQIVRNKPAVIAQPNSADQTTIRNRMAEAYNYWLALTQLQRNHWAEMAEQVAGFPLPPGGIENLVPKLGGPMSGFNCFVSFSMSAVAVGGSWPTEPPLTEQRPNSPTGVAAAYVTPTLTVTWIDPAVSDAGAKVRIWVLGRHRVYHRQVLNTTYALAVQTAAITGANGAGGIAIAFTVPEVAGNEKLIVQMDTVNPSGLRSQGSNIATVGIN